MAPYRTYNEDRLSQAAREAALRIVLTERNLQRALARQQQVEAATERVRKLLARARGDLLLIAAILAERETFFAAEEETTSKENQKEPDSVITLRRPDLPPPDTLSPPGSCSPPRLTRSAR